MLANDRIALSSKKSEIRSLILGDSLTFGRPNYQILYEDSWPGILEDHGQRVFHRGRGGGDSNLVLNEASHLASYMAPASINGALFNYSFVQVGIVDCTPRLLPRKINKIAKTLPVTRGLLSDLKRNKWLLKTFGKPWVGFDEFEENILRAIEITKRLAEQTFFIEIARPTNFLRENCGDFSALVDSYNAILRKVPGANFITVYGGTNIGNYFLPDGHHLTKAGHQNVAGKIIENISEKAGV